MDRAPVTRYGTEIPAAVSLPGHVQPLASASPELEGRGPPSAPERRCILDGESSRGCHIKRLLSHEREDEVEVVPAVIDEDSPLGHLGALPPVGRASARIGTPEDRHGDMADRRRSRAGPDQLESLDPERCVLPVIDREDNPPGLLGSPLDVEQVFGRNGQGLSRRRREGPTGRPREPGRNGNREGCRYLQNPDPSSANKASVVS